MGLDTTHDCWHGAYSYFTQWREMLAAAAGMPPLRMMEGFGGTIKWDILKPRPLHWLLDHSDCDGDIPPEQCGPIADELESLLPLIPTERNESHWLVLTQRFIDGLRLAASRGEAVEFH